MKREAANYLSQEPTTGMALPPKPRQEKVVNRLLVVHFLTLINCDHRQNGHAGEVRADVEVDGKTCQVSCQGVSFGSSVTSASFHRRIYQLSKSSTISQLIRWRRPFPLFHPPCKVDLFLEYKGVS